MIDLPTPVKFLRRDIPHCDRCGGSHLNFPIARLPHEIRVANRVFNYGTRCPVDGKPLLIDLDESFDAPQPRHFLNAITK